MSVRIRALWKRLSLAQRFMLASLAILASAMLGVGWWVGREIEAGVIHRTAATTALYVDSFVAPHLQGLAHAASPIPEHQAALSRLLQDTPLGQHIVEFKVWDATGRVVYSANPSTIGRVFPVDEGLAHAWQGEVVSRISDLRDEENVVERERWTRLLETYSPVRLIGTSRIIAVAEFYQTADDLHGEIIVAQMRSWSVVGGATLAMYLLLAGMVQRGSDTIARQRAELSDKVAQLTELLAQNEELHRRVRRAAQRTAALNERFLRRISAELHDGPAQDVALALLRLDSVAAGPQSSPGGGQSREEWDTIRSSLAHALQEVRVISAGLRLPELENLTLPETLARVVRGHERRTGTKVTLRLGSVPEEALLPVKITVYRVVQEALNNAYRHGGGIGQRVVVGCEAGRLSVEVADQGPGFDWAQMADWDGHLGLAGMRERVESLGGLFRIETGPGRGTRVIICLSLPCSDSSRGQ